MEVGRFRIEKCFHKQIMEVSFNILLCCSLMQLRWLSLLYAALNKWHIHIHQCSTFTLTVYTYNCAALPFLPRTLTLSCNNLRLRTGIFVNSLLQLLFGRVVKNQMLMLLLLNDLFHIWTLMFPFTGTGSEHPAAVAAHTNICSVKYNSFIYLHSVGYNTK